MKAHKKEIICHQVNKVHKTTAAMLPDVPLKRRRYLPKKERIGPILKAFGIDYIINILKHHFHRPLEVTSDNTGMSAVCLPITRSRVPTEAFWPFRLKAVHL